MPNSGSSSKPTRFQDVAELDYDRACGYCQNKGYTQAEGLLAKVLGVDVWFDLEYKRACDCQQGKTELALSQTITGCDCQYGRRVVYPDPNRFWIREMEFCLQCSEGKTLAARLDGMIAAKQQQLYDTLNTGLTKELREKKFTNYTEPEGAEIKSRLQDALFTGRNILLMGDTGIGKTHLAAACLNSYLNQGKTGIFVSLIDLMRQLRKTIRDTNGPDWDTLLDRYTEADLLVLDDLGQEKASEKVNEVVFHLLNSRLNQGKQTIVTTNYSLKKLVETVGYTPAIKSRLASYEQIIWDSEDYRTRKD